MKKCFLLLIMYGLCAALHAQARPKVSVHVSLDTYIEGYLRWEKMYPEIEKKNGPLKLGMPSLDIYSPHGRCIFYGEDGATNAARIRKLPGGLSGAGTVANRPSLKDAIEMIPAVSSQKSELLKTGKYTIFAVNYAHWPPGRPQSEAIAAFLRSNKQANVQVVEVFLDQ